MQQKLLVVFPDGVGIRNYLYSSTFENTDQDVMLFHNFGEETIDYLKGVRNFGRNYTIPEYKESLREKFLRELICLCRLRHNAGICKNPTLLLNWKRQHKKLAMSVFYQMIEAVAPLYSRYDSILALEEKYQLALRKNPFYHKIFSMLRDIKPDSIFCTHQRGLKMPSIFAAATDLGIKTTTVIYSWDNLPKARLALRADNYNVWSDYMKLELESYYPEIDSTKISVSGTPQFEFYQNPDNIIPRDEFYSRYRLDSRKIICYSGDDRTTSPDDPKYLADIANAVVSAGLHKEFQILFRRCPVDFSDRYDELLAQFPELIKSAPPLWQVKNNGHWTEVFPLEDDVPLLVSTAFYSDVVINIGSTMAFDFAQFDKPCLYLNYDQSVKNDSSWSVKTIYQFQHFKSMEGLEPVGWINSKQDIVPLILKSITTPAEVGIDRKRWFKIITGSQTAIDIKSEGKSNSIAL